MKFFFGGRCTVGYLPQTAQGAPKLAGPTTLKSMEKILIADALRRHNGNWTLAAKDLGINTSTLFRKIKSLGIEIPTTDGRSRKRGDAEIEGAGFEPATSGL